MSLPLGGGAMGAPPVPMGGSAEDQGVKAVRLLSNRAIALRHHGMQMTNRYVNR